MLTWITCKESIDNHCGCPYSFSPCQNMSSVVTFWVNCRRSWPKNGFMAGLPFFLCCCGLESLTPDHGQLIVFLHFFGNINGGRVYSLWSKKTGTWLDLQMQHWDTCASLEKWWMHILSTPHNLTKPLKSLLILVVCILLCKRNTQVFQSIVVTPATIIAKINEEDVMWAKAGVHKLLDLPGLGEIS